MWRLVAPSGRSRQVVARSVDAAVDAGPATQAVHGRRSPTRNLSTNVDLLGDAVSHAVSQSPDSESRGGTVHSTASDETVLLQGLRDGVGLVQVRSLLTSRQIYRVIQAKVRTGIQRCSWVSTLARLQPLELPAIGFGAGPIRPTSLWRTRCSAGCTISIRDSS